MYLVLGIRYAVRHTPTGNWMPELGKHASHWEPDQQYPNNPPRLFATMAAAHSAVTHWALGIRRTKWDEYGCDITVIEPCPDRRPADMEVVPVSLIVQQEKVLLP